MPKYLVSLPCNPPMILDAASPEEATEAYRVTCGIISTTSPFEVNEIPEPESKKPVKQRG